MKRWMTARPARSPDLALLMVEVDLLALLKMELRLKLTVPPAARTIARAAAPST
jgi:hypothetical protein